MNAPSLRSGTAPPLSNWAAVRTSSAKPISISSRPLAQWPSAVGTSSAIARYAAVCFGGEILPSGLAEQIDETAGPHRSLNNWPEAAFHRARVAMLIISHARRHICHNVAYRIVRA